MLRRLVHNNKSAVGIRLHEFSAGLKKAPPLIYGATKLFFLCGANQPSGAVSARRNAIKRFIETECPSHRVVYAERVLTELTRLGHSGNLLDIEEDISLIVDLILIVLESPSAFCELGAFAHRALRHKLVIINDKKFSMAKSFINLGPIAAAKGANSPLLLYPMTADGMAQIDAIGSIFNALSLVLGATSHGRHMSVHEKLSKLNATKFCMYFAHDLVFLIGPTSYAELIETLKVLFGHDDYGKLRQLLSILIASDFIETYKTDDKLIYRSTLNSTFLRYRTNVNSLIAAFRHFHLRSHPERFRHGGPN